MTRNIIFLAFVVLAFSGCIDKETPEDGIMMKNLNVTSTAFIENGNIPDKYTCNGEGVSPPLHIEGIPEGTMSLAIIVDDPDAPRGVFDHWLVWDIPMTQDITEDGAPEGAVQGTNSGARNSYYSPCPPSGMHRYRFKVYALDTMLGITEKSRRQDLEKAMQGHVLAQGMLTGLYGRK